MGDGVQDGAAEVAGIDLAANLADLVRTAAAERGDRAALVGSHGSTSWGVLDTSVDRMAAALRALGLIPGDRLALVLGNVVEFGIAYFGALRAGLVVVPVNTAYTARVEVPLHGDVQTEARQFPGVRLFGTVSFDPVGDGTKLTERVLITAPRPLAPFTVREAVKAHQAMLVGIRQCFERP